LKGGKVERSKDLLPVVTVEESDVKKGDSRKGEEVNRCNTILKRAPIRNAKNASLFQPDEVAELPHGSN